MGKALIIGCGGVASVAIHKCCQNSEAFEEICIASRTKSKCDALKAKLDIAVEEIFVNIAHYAYAPDEGEVVIELERLPLEPNIISIKFTDWGVPYDPLAKPDPDITLGAEERQIGGLGIFIVKNTMDDMKYEYKDRHNILTIRKNF